MRDKDAALFIGGPKNGERIRVPLKYTLGRASLGSVKMQDGDKEHEYVLHRLTYEMNIAVHTSLTITQALKMLLDCYENEH